MFLDMEELLYVFRCLDEDFYLVLDRALKRRRIRPRLDHFALCDKNVNF